MKKILGILALLIVVFLIFVATRPDTFHVERSASIAAPPEAVFANINDPHRWAAWTAWDKLDPAMQKTFEPTTAGVGSGYHWTGNKAVGEGRMTITESEPGRKVGVRLEFIKPFQAMNTSTFTLTPEGAETRVNWSMEGANNFMSKAMCIFMSMDAMVGPDFEKGLAALKTVTEAEAQTPAGAASDSAAVAQPR